MPKNLKPFIISFALTVLLLPNFVSALGDVDTPGATSSCITISNNLRTAQRVIDTGIANNKNDVIALQNFLNTQKYLSEASVTGYFGTLTAQAVIAFQNDNGILPIPPTGFVGPITRAKINEISCSGVVSNHANSDNNVTNSNTVNTSNNNPSADSVSSGTPTITLTSPKAGGTFTQGGNIYIVWNGSSAPVGAHVVLFLVNAQTGTSLGIITRNKAITGSYTFLIPTPKVYTCSSCTGIYNAPPVGLYKVVAKIYTPVKSYFQEGISMNTNNLPEPTYLATTDSATFKIIGPTNTNQQIVATQPATTTLTNPASGVTNTDGDLCKKEGLDNIDEGNYSADKNTIWAGFPNYDSRGYIYKMNPGQSYSFPIDTSIPRQNFQASEYTSTYQNVVNISDKKCDFITRKVNCFSLGASASGAVSYSVNAKFADPNWKPIPYQADLYTLSDYSDMQACRLLPGKKYYVNVRWLRKSDIVDSSGKIKNDSDPLFSALRAGLRVKSVSELNKYLDETFNGYGDSCLSVNDTSGAKCATDYFFGSVVPGMPKFSPQRQKEVDVILEAIAAKNIQNYQTDLAAQLEVERIQKQKFDAIPNCGNDWQTIGTFGCRINEQTQIFTTCKPPEFGYGKQMWPGTPSNPTWTLMTGRSCN